MAFLNFEEPVEDQMQNGPPPWKKRVPDGWYGMRITEADPFTSKNGNECWGLKLIPVDGNGEYFIASDVLVFSEKARSYRARLLYHTLGIVKHGDNVEVFPPDIANGEVAAFLEWDPDRECMQVRFKGGYEDISKLEQLQSVVRIRGMAGGTPEALSRAYKSRVEGEHQSGAAPRVVGPGGPKIAERMEVPDDDIPF